MARFTPRPSGDTVQIIPELSLVDIENAVGSRLMLAALGLARPPAVDGRYRLLALLGRGARGLVCRAYDDHLRREVALKLYPAGEPGPVAREVASEAQALARLRHPNIVGVFDFGNTSLAFEAGELGPEQGPAVVPCFFMTMEYVRGQSLRRWLSNEQRSREEVLSVFAQAGEGLAHAHEAGVVHRDFKPENVMLDDDGRVLVVDFGLASRRPGTLEPTSMSLVPQGPLIVGTPEYMAPEARVGQASAASDQYGFAVTLHEALMGELPPVNSAGLAYVDTRRFPGALGRVLARAMAFDPGHRYATMRELLAELPRRWDDQWRWAPLDDEPPDRARPPWLVLALGGVVLVGGLGAWAGARALADHGSDDDEPGEVASVGDCPSELEGSWQLETLDLRDFRLSRRRARGQYQLSVERSDARACAFSATLRKTGWTRETYPRALTGHAPLELLRDEHGRVELRGDWVIDDGDADAKDDGTQHVAFDLHLVDGTLRGDYRRFVAARADGIERPSMIGPAYAAREGRALPRVGQLDEVPCPSQCNVLCAGHDATAACRAEQCESFDARVVDCGAPSADFVDPRTTVNMLQHFASGSWQPASSGAACEGLPDELAGQWVVWQRLDAGPSQRWLLTLDAQGCVLTGTATRSGQRRAVRAEIDAMGRWLVHDSADADELVWALLGWEFAVGTSGGGSPGRLSAYRAF